MWRVLGDASPYWRLLPPELRDTLPTPSLVVFMDDVRANVSRMISRAGGAARWRPHLKTTKLRPVWAHLLRAGVRSFKCATVREAALFLDVVAEERVHGVDLLCNHQSAPNARRLAEATSAHASRALGTSVSLLVEAPETAAALPAGLGGWLDLNPSAGPDPSSPSGAFDRTGCPAADKATAGATVRQLGERFRGVHWYDGHNPPPSSYDGLLATLDALPFGDSPFGRAEHVPLVTSGTPTFEGALDHAALGARHAAAVRARSTGTHQVSPGTVVFADGRTLEQTCASLGLRPAALVLTSVVSCPAPDVLTCDAGSKSLAAETGDPCADAVGAPGLLALRPFEEHLPIRWLPAGEGARAAARARGGEDDAAAAAASGVKPRRGDLLLLCPRHVCPTVNLAERALLVEEGREATWAVVEGRAH
ncbi:hypothetical protein KFE25_007324 [Diacronema lutheri]|uniref:D-serine dehydratase-like domain-containing protein n=2 Tax=Diacronema lutheri TaxID=2081491 RepID=A0A8J5XH63_DIALT|nr:hypothetical protein KFE25_007324 [Diacronema lutheri]